jgi:FkbM family methyltransferase
MASIRAGRAGSSCRYYQPDISRLLETLLRPGDQYVDVGANIGLTALLARSRIGETGVTNFQLVPRAVADCESVLTLFVPRDEMLLGTFVPEKPVGTRVDVRTEPADRYVADFDPDKPTLIKIDVEGYEVQVLRGIQSLLARSNVMVVTEIADTKLRRAGHSRDELHSLLASFGLLPHTIDVRATRWRKALELCPIPGPVDSYEYDALFARPGSSVFRERIEPVLVRTAASL